MLRSLHVGKYIAVSTLNQREQMRLFDERIFYNTGDVREFVIGIISTIFIIISITISTVRTQYKLPHNYYCTVFIYTSSFQLLIIRYYFECIVIICYHYYIII